MADFQRNPNYKYPKKVITFTISGIPLLCFAVLIVEAAERYGFYGGLSINSLFMREMYNYNAAQVNVQSNLLSFWGYGTTVLCGWLADSYFGKIKTIGFFGLFYVVGVVLQAFSSMPLTWCDFPYHTGGGSSQYLFWSSIFFIGIGMGAIKGNVGPLLSEQITNPSDELTEKVFRYYYWTINLGSLFAFIFSPILHSFNKYPNPNSGAEDFPHGTTFYYSYWLAASILLLSIICFFLFSQWFIEGKVQESPLTRFFRAIVSGIKNRKGLSLVEGETHFIFKAKNATKQEMIDYKRVFGICGLLIHYPTFWYLYNQVSSYVTVQGSYMDGPSWLTPDLFLSFDPITVIIFVPIMDSLVFPFLRKHGFKLNIITRISIGYVFMSLAGVSMIIIQVMLQENGTWNDDGDYSLNENGTKLSVWYTMIPFIFCGLGEIFASVTINEFTYSQAPNSMKSIMFALGSFTNCGASVIGLIIADGITNDNLQWYLLAFGIISVLQAIFLPYQFRNYNYRSVVEDNPNNTVNTVSESSQDLECLEYTSTDNIKDEKLIETSYSV
eukprot:Nk52_evm12s374 gene=Nk52_evmTU12s374